MHKKYKSGPFLKLDSNCSDFHLYADNGMLF